MTDHQADLIERLIGSGQYEDASDVLRAGLRLLQQHHAEQEARLIALRDAVQVGLDDVAAGRYRTFESVTALQSHLSVLTDTVLDGKAG